MTSKTQERNFQFSFPNTETGRELRRNTAESLTHNEMTFEESEETITAEGLTFVLLHLTVTGKRPGEGQIAAEMKERKS